MALRRAGVEVMRVGRKSDPTDLAAALRLIGDRGITRLMLEGGPRLADAFAAADCLDEVRLLRAAQPLSALSKRAGEPAILPALENWLRRADVARVEETRLGATALSSTKGRMPDVHRYRDSAWRTGACRATQRSSALARHPLALRGGGIALGASICCSGVCLTVTSVAPEGDGSVFTVDAAAETLALTTVGRWIKGTSINLERSLRIGDELGGHIVTGHVDGLARLDASRRSPKLRATGARRRASG